MNLDIARAYYRATKCSEDKPPGYRQLLFAEFTRMRPDLGLTEQNVADRWNVIKKKGYLTNVEMQNICRQVGFELQQAALSADDTAQSQNNIPNISNESSIPSQETEGLASSSIENNPNDDGDIRSRFFSLIEFHRNTDPTSRPRIPKLNNIRKTTKRLTGINKVLNDYLQDKDDVDEILLAIYCAAVTIIELNGQRTYQPRQRNRQQPSKRKPAWQWRLEKSIDQFRSKADLLDQYLDGSRSRKVKKKILALCAEANIDLESPNAQQQLLELKDTYRQKAKVKGARLRRYNETTKRKEQNKDYVKNRRSFFRHQDNQAETKCQQTDLDCAEFRMYWSSIWCVEKHYNDEAGWTPEVAAEYTELQQMSLTKFTVEDVAKAVKRTSNWKSPGPDGIQNVWIKYFTATHEPLARSFTAILNDPSRAPHYLTEGVTFLLHKKGDMQRPENYRPITCLSVLYKLLTALLYDKIYEHCEVNGIIEEEQKGCIKRSLGCKHQLTIDAVVLKQVQTKQRNLSMAYIDYTKAFDSVPHDWLLKVLDIYKIDLKVKHLLSSMMNLWKTRLMVNGQQAGMVNIKSGIFQGDTLSPLWFCLALNPLSKLLNNTKVGYKLTRNASKKLNHLLLMDDLKLYAETSQKLKSLLNTVEIFSNDIGMSFGLEKCAIVNIRKGSIEQTGEEFQGIGELEETSVYKYLGILQNIKLDHTQLKQEFAEKYRRRVTKICNTKLTGKRIIDSINCWAVPVLTYSFGILKWSNTDLEGLDRLTRSNLTKFRFLHPNSSTTRLYLPRKEGGRGLVNVQKMCRTHESKMRVALRSSNCELMKLAIEADDGYTPLKLQRDDSPREIPSVHEEIQTWKDMEMHGRFPRLIDGGDVDRQASLTWLLYEELYPETEGFFFAIQDRVINTRNYQKYVLKMDVVDRCRKCEKPGESLEHIISGCSALSSSVYLGRHNQVAKLIHQQLAIKFGMLDNDTPPYYKYSPPEVLETSNHIMYWDRPLFTDRPVAHNKPDIVIIHKNEKSATFIDVAIPLTHNIKSTEVEKVRKYEDLAIQMKDIWKLERVNIYPFVISAEAVVTQNFQRIMEKIGMPKWIFRTIQKIVILQTCQIVRRFFN